MKFPPETADCKDAVKTSSFVALRGKGVGTVEDSSIAIALPFFFPDFAGPFFNNVRSSDAAEAGV